MGFNKNVFINCAFNDDYRFLLKPLLFTVLYCGFDPQISETKDSGDNRINNIKNLIRLSRFSIHDLSRSGPMRDGEYPQFNMPYELGLDIGCKEYGLKKYAVKKCLILERNEYQYLRVLSDIRGQDINHHNDDPEKLIEAVRNWFVKIHQQGLPAANLIWDKYNEFYNDFINNLKNEGWTDTNINSMPFSEYTSIAKKWIKASA